LNKSTHAVRISAGGEIARPAATVTARAGDERFEAKNLKADQLKAGCVGQPGMSPEEILKEQPYFSAELRKEIGPGGIPTCKAANQ